MDQDTSPNAWTHLSLIGCYPCTEMQQGGSLMNGDGASLDVQTLDLWKFYQICREWHGKGKWSNSSWRGRLEGEKPGGKELKVGGRERLHWW